MQTLQDILYKVHLQQVQGATNIRVSAIEIDSRKVIESSVFIAIKGLQSDGHYYIGKAIDLGAIAIVCEILPTKLVEGITYVKVKNTNEAVAYMAHNFYDEPSDKTKLVGVTGTSAR